MKAECSVEECVKRCGEWLDRFGFGSDHRLSVKRLHGQIVLCVFEGDKFVKSVDCCVFDSFVEAKLVRELLCG